MGASAARCKGAKFPGDGWTQCRSLELTYGAGLQKQQLRWPRQDDDWRLLHAYFRTIDQAAVEWFAQEAQLWPPNAGLIPQSAGVVTDLTRLRCDGLFGDK